MITMIIYVVIEYGVWKQEVSVRQIDVSIMILTLLLFGGF